MTNTTNQPLTAAELEAIEDEFYALDYKDEVWTEADLARRAELAKILAAHGIVG